MAEYGNEEAADQDDVEYVVVDVGACQWRGGYASDEGPGAVVANDDTDDEQRWRGVLDELEAEAEYTAVLLSEAPGTPRASRERALSTLFGTLKVRAAYIAPPALAVAFGTERVTGLFVDVGERSTVLWALFEGYPVLEAATVIPLGGGHLTDWLGRCMRDKAGGGAVGERVAALEGRPPPADAAWAAAAREAKEASAQVQLDYRRPRRQPPVSASCPGGDSVSLSHDELARCAEGMLDPPAVGLPDAVPGLARAVCRTVGLCALPVREALYANVVLAGGGSLLAGLPERLERDVKEALAAAKCEWKVPSTDGTRSSPRVACS